MLRTHQSPSYIPKVIETLHLCTYNLLTTPLALIFPSFSFFSFSSRRPAVLDSSQNPSMTSLFPLLLSPHYLKNLFNSVVIFFGTRPIIC